jgi:hypothetical protein
MQANKQATIRLKMDCVACVIVMFEWDSRSFSGLHHLHVTNQIKQHIILYNIWKLHFLTI